MEGRGGVEKRIRLAMVHVRKRVSEIESLGRLICCAEIEAQDVS
jgi:hypothetical protein